MPPTVDSITTGSGEDVYYQHNCKLTVPAVPGTCVEQLPDGRVRPTASVPPKPWGVVSWLFCKNCDMRRDQHAYANGRDHCLFSPTTYEPGLHAIVSVRIRGFDLRQDSDRDRYSLRKPERIQAPKRINPHPNTRNRR